MYFPIVTMNILEKNAVYFYDRVYHARNKEDENCYQIRILIIKQSRNSKITYMHTEMYFFTFYICKYYKDY